jgi:hypothetical protein
MITTITIETVANGYILHDNQPQFIASGPSHVCETQASLIAWLKQNLKDPHKKETTTTTTGSASRKTRITDH